MKMRLKMDAVSGYSSYLEKGTVLIIKYCVLDRSFQCFMEGKPCAVLHLAAHDFRELLEPLSSVERSLEEL